MITIGIDAHKDTHTLVALNETGRRLGALTVPARSHGHVQALDWAHQLDPAAGGVVFAVEDCRHVTGLLERDLIAADACAVRVPTVLAARARTSVRTPGKSDEIDAHAIARAAQSEQHLAPIQAEPDSEQTAVLKEISRAREQLVADRTRMINRLRGDLHRYDPEHAIGDLGGLKHPTAVRAWLYRQHPTQAERQVQRGLLIDALTALLAITRRINDLTTRIRHDEHVTASPLQTIPGCGTTTTADIATTMAPARHYRSADAFASACALTPIPIASGRSQAMRINPGGNKRLKAAFHRIAEYQSRTPGTLGYQHYQRLTTSGKTHRAALRIIRCLIAKHAWRLLIKADPLT